MTLDEQLERLYARHRFGIKPGLELEKELVERLGHPERRFRSVHVAGTNGKGSVCALLDSILIEAGLVTGRYTSPHLVRFNERFCIGGRAVGDNALLKAVGRVEAEASGVAAKHGREPTFFECGTAVAFELFAERPVDVAVIETGLGGRWDATNVIVPLVSVITRIDMDHMAILGNTLTDIAAEKAGIIKPRVPVVCGAMPDEAMAVIKTVAAAVGSPFVSAPERITVALKSRSLAGQRVVVESSDQNYGVMDLPMHGEHQLENLAVAVAAAEVLRDQGLADIDEKVLRRGVKRTWWPGRLQVLSEKPVIILDGAHNPGGARALAASIRHLTAGKPVGLVAGFCSDKDVKGFLAELPGGIRKAWIVPVPNERRMSFDEVKSAAAGVRLAEMEPAEIREGILAARDWALKEDGCVIIAGSLFLAGAVLGMLSELGFGEYRYDRA